VITLNISRLKRIQRASGMCEFTCAMRGTHTSEVFWCALRRNLYLKMIKVRYSLYSTGVTQRVGRGITLLFHYCGTRKGWVVSSTPRPHVTLGKEPVPILQEAECAPGPVWTGGISRPHRGSIPDHPSRSSVAIPTGLLGPRNLYCIRK